MPEFSVIIPTYNREHVIGRAIESVLNQTYENFELLVVDDGSEDDTATVVTGYDDPRIQFLDLGKNKGANHARNVGIKTASAKYVSFLDSDDEFTPTHLEVIHKRLADTPDDCIGAFTSYQLVENGKVRDVSPAKPELITLSDIIRKNIIGGFSTITVEKRAFETVGYLDEKLQSRQDYEFYLRLLDEYRLLGIDEELTVHYRDENRITDDVNRIIAGQKRLNEKHGEKLNIESNMTDTYYARAFAYARDRQMSNARTCFWKAITEDPTNWLAYYHLVSSLFGYRGFVLFKELKRSIRLRLVQVLQK